MKWLKGRQSSGYYKLPIFGGSWPVNFDVWFLKFPPGAKILPHSDKVPTGKHYRLNIIVKNAKEGGEYFGEFLWRSRRIILFRPDKMVHGVTKVTSGTRYVFSVGWIK